MIPPHRMLMKRGLRRDVLAALREINYRIMRNPAATS